MGLTGHILQIKVEHVEAGYLDLYCKGGKLRRIYIPKRGGCKYSFASK